MPVAVVHRILEVQPVQPAALPPVPFPRFRARALTRGALVLLLASSGWRCTRADATSLSPLLRDLAGAAGKYRSITPRLSISRQYAPCREAPPPAEGTVVRGACDSIPGRLTSSRTLQRVARAAREGGVQSAALHASGLMDLLWSQPDRAVQDLQSAARLSEAPAPILADLAAAYLVRAEHTQMPGDLDAAMEMAERALEEDSANVAARYNLALALERAGLAEQANAEWRAYLRVDSVSGWAGEARAFLRDTLPNLGPPARPTPALAADFARRLPQQANTWGWEVLLPAWGAAYEKGQAASADSALRLAEAAGQALVAARRDATLADAVAVLRAADPATARRLARAHQDYGEARRLYHIGDREVAARLMARVVTRAADSPLLQWASVEFAAAHAHAPPQRPESEAVARRVVAQTDSVRYPALAGRARWILGTILSFSGKYPDARSWYLRGAGLFGRGGEEEHAACTLYLASDALYRSGGTLDTDPERHRALLRLRRYAGSQWRLNALEGGATRASETGLLRAAMRFHMERVDAARRSGQYYMTIETRLARARLNTVSGDTALALEDVREAERLMDSLPQFARNWFQSDAARTRAGTELRSRPGMAAKQLETAVATFHGRHAILLDVLVTRADAWLGAGLPDSARVALEQAADLLREQAATVQNDPLRGALFARARGVIDRLVLMTARTVDARAALEQLERARAVFAPFPRSAPSRLRMPAGKLGLSYTLVADTLLTLAADSDSVWMIVKVVPGAELLRNAEIVRLSLERGLVVDTAAQAGLAALYDVLIRPLAPRMSGQPSLVIAADGPLASVPFSALYDRTRRRYLIEDHVPRMVATLSGTERTERRVIPARVLLVGDPAFDRRDNPGLAPLRGAAGEVDSIALLYRAPMRLMGRDADSTRLASELEKAEIVHFGGHAVLDDTRPERSFLLLAGGGNAGRMTAEEISEMNLRGVQLVVLSACETARAPDGRSRGLAGLSAALLGAGADAVVGSLWRVDDQLTTPLMVAFHREYARTGDAAAALRAAQLTLLRSSDPRLRSPAAWAGFVHLGN